MLASTWTRPPGRSRSRTTPSHGGSVRSIPPSTRTQVETYFRLHVYPVLGDMELRAIRSSDVQAWVTGRTKKLAPGSVELVYRYVASVLLDASRTG